MQKVKSFFVQNIQFLCALALLLMILVLSLFPQKFSNATFSGIKVWAEILLPSMFVFFVLTKLLVSNKATSKVFLPIDKVMSKIYKTKKYCGYVFSLSILAGYPVGAKVVSELYSAGEIGQNDAKKILALSSTSSPMFIIGSLGSGIFSDTKLGCVVLFSHILSSLFNGLVFRKQSGENLYKKRSVGQNRANFSEIVQDSIISILMVGGYISLCFTLVEFLLIPISKLAISESFVVCFIKGIIEVTSGCVALSKMAVSTKLLAITLSALVSFGGLCIHFQSYIFLKKVGIKYSYFLKIKLVQTLFAVLSSVVLAFVFL